MKNFLLLSLGAVLLLSACKTTSKVTVPDPKRHQLSVELKPNKAYFSTIETTTVTKVIIPGMDPVEQQQASYTEGVLQVGSIDDIGSKSLLTIIDSMEVSMPVGMEDAPELEFENWRIYQHLTAQDSMVMDSIVGVPTDYEAVMVQMMQSMNQSYRIPIPEKGMLIEESFVQDVPIAMELPGDVGRMDMTVSTTYTLTAIDKVFAHFDNAIAITGTMEIMGEVSNIVGKGTGTAKLNHKDNYMVAINNAINQDIEMNMMGQVMVTSTATTTKLKVDMKDNRLMGK